MVGQTTLKNNQINMWNKIKTFLKEHLNNFLASLLVVLAIIFSIIYLPKWAIVVIISVSFLLLLAYKIWKNQPF